MRAAGVATALYGWMERFAREGVEWDWGSLYAACAASGVDAVETDPTPAKREILDRLGLRVSASYIGMPLTPPFADLGVHERVMPVARRLADAGGEVLVLNSDAPGGGASARKSAAEVRRQGENLSRIADLVAPLGLRIALHNHAAVHADATADLSSVVEHADAGVGLCIDTAWALVAGHDPIAWARDYAPRVLAVHLRNQEGVLPTETLPEGELDVAAFLDALGDYDGWLTLELWHPEPLTPGVSMQEAVRASAGWLRRQAPLA
ncbi:sugar phosphate isomerase/epimerase family protein [Microbacterium timonense]|uniref:sugar phosphate isomerase/epimerase family protein n=1 Tax=Microbacterium timonense TaxID=2086576 RepID=UPI000D103C3F|nr:sugar phosphate isomerase/epimerase family protein [Microbacterium timonense]